MANGYIKVCSASLIIKQMQIKTTMRDHLTYVRIAYPSPKTNKQQKKANVGKNVDKEETLVLALPCLQQHYPQEPTHGNNINVHHQKKWIKKF